MVSTLIAQIVRFARPNIQIYDAHVVDLYQWVCARYLVGVRVQKQRQAQLSSALDRISERITLAFQTLSRPEAIWGSTTETQIYVIFNRIWRRECQSIPIERSSIFDLPSQNPPFELPPENGDFAFDTPVQWTLIDNSATPAPSWTALPWPPSANPPVVGLTLRYDRADNSWFTSFASCPTFPSTMNFCGVLATAQPICSPAAPTLQNWRQEAGCGDRTDRAILCV